MNAITPSLSLQFSSQSFALMRPAKIYIGTHDETDRFSKTDVVIGYRHPTIQFRMMMLREHESGAWLASYTENVSRYWCAPVPTIPVHLVGCGFPEIDYSSCEPPPYSEWDPLWWGGWHEFNCGNDQDQAERFSVYVYDVNPTPFEILDSRRRRSITSEATRLLEGEKSKKMGK